MNPEIVWFTQKQNKNMHQMENYLTEAEMLAGLDEIRQSPKDHGTLELIVVRPKENERVILKECSISAKLGVHGDNWALGCWKMLPDGSPHPEVQVAIMNSRCIALLAQDKSRWALAGDNLYVDLDLSNENIVHGQKLAIGSAILEITSQAHNGCKKFSQRYGQDAVKFVNSPVGKQLHLRGIYAKIIKDGAIKVGDTIKKI
jgi:hypothetical protein